MPIKPQPFVLECPKCNWSKAFAPKSDCMIRGLDWVSECPVCGHGELKRREPNAIEQFMLKLGRVFQN